MPRYVKDCRKDYNAGEISAVQLVQSVLSKANAQSDKNKRLAEQGITALYKLSGKASPNKFFPIKEIYAQAGIDPGQTPSCGLWVWNDKIGCGIVEERKRKREYRIKNEFRKAVPLVL